MIKRAPSRTQRSKGIKVKHVLQICLLLGVCFWLIYQVKHSHDKKKEYDDKDAKVSVKAHSDNEILKLGRKDLPRVQEAVKNERHEDEEEDAVEEEEIKPEEEEKKVGEHEEEERDAVEGQEEANKHDEEEHEDDEQEENKNEEQPEEAGSKHEEEEEQEEESKNEATEDESRGGGDDELDEQDQERTEGEADHVGEFIDEEKEREGEGDERESERNEGEEKNSQVENENSLDDQDHEGVDRNTHVTREEHYKADDASSAVSHDNQIIISETEKATSENSNENSDRNVLEEGNKSNTTNEIGVNQKNKELNLREGEMAESGSTSNGTTTEEKDHEAGSYNSKDGSPLTANNNSAEGGTRISNNSTGSSTEMSGSSLQNGTETILHANPTPAQNVTLDGAINMEAAELQTNGLEKGNNSDTASNGNQFDSNTTISTKTLDADASTGDSFNTSAHALTEMVTRLNATADGEVSSGSSTRNETADTTQNKTSNSNSESGGTNESSDSLSTEGTVDAISDSESGETNESSDSSSTKEIVKAAKEDPIDSSDSSILQNEKESRTNPGTLPDIRVEVNNSKEAAAE